MQMENRSFLSRHSSGLAQLCIWGLLFSIPMLFVVQGYGGIVELMVSWLEPIGFMMAVFYLNYWIFVPKFLFRHRKKWFFISNILLQLLLVAVVLFIINIDYQGSLRDITLEITVMSILMICSFTMFVFVALALRGMQRNQYLEHKQLLQNEELARMETERLKAQLNPHFIFNSLNNISALVEINPENARDAISRLSFLMRYVLEQGGIQFVPLNSELDFIRDYIALMSLRYTDSLTIVTDFPPTESTAKLNVPPMLFISLVENAFKHGASSTTKSFIKVSLRVDDAVRFRVENTLLPPSHSKSAPGHGVGLDNLTRRLNILFPESHSITHGADKKNGSYLAEITIPRNN